MNYNQRRTYQQNWHMLLRRYEKKYLPRILKALEGEAKRFIAEAERAGFQTAFRSFGLVNPQLLSVIEQMHKEVGLKFGKDVNRYLTRTQKISFFNANFLLNLVEILTRQALELLTSVETTTKERILQILNRSTVEQLSFVDTARLITEQVANPERALTITRTESNRAANIAAFEAARLQDYEVTKEWISSIDSRTRRYREKDEYDHAILDGTVQELDQAFQQTGRTKGIIANAQYPLDAQAPAAFTINCRCVMTFENKRDAQGRLVPKWKKVVPPKVNISENEIIQIIEQNNDTFIPGKNFDETSIRLKQYIEGKSGIKIGPVKVGKGGDDKEINIDQYNRKAEQVAKLFTEYKLSDNTVNGSQKEVKLSFSSSAMYLGRVNAEGNSKGRQLVEINFGHKDGKQTRLTPEANKRLKDKSTVDEQNIDISTVTHEFAHVLTFTDEIKWAEYYGVNNDSTRKISSFWDEIKKVHRRYKKESRENYIGFDNYEKLNTFHLGNYADTNLDEFVAEGFTEYKLNSKAGKYAIEIGQIIDKYFKR